MKGLAGIILGLSVVLCGLFFLLGQAGARSFAYIPSLHGRVISSLVEITGVAPPGYIENQVKYQVDRGQPYQASELLLRHLPHMSLARQARFLDGPYHVLNWAPCDVLHSFDLVEPRGFVPRADSPLLARALAQKRYCVLDAQSRQIQADIRDQRSLAGHHAAVLVTGLAAAAHAQTNLDICRRDSVLRVILDDFVDQVAMAILLDGFAYRDLSLTRPGVTPGSAVLSVTQLCGASYEPGQAFDPPDRADLSLQDRLRADFDPQFRATLHRAADHSVLVRQAGADLRARGRDPGSEIRAAFGLCAGNVHPECQHRQARGGGGMRGTYFQPGQSAFQICSTRKRACSTGCAGLSWRGYPGQSSLAALFGDGGARASCRQNCARITCF
jgi:hypothetical protein